jgi:3-oxoacyl-[acyl-carrier-protein] synthase II
MPFCNLSIVATNEKLGVRRTWQRLIEGHCGITSIKDRSPQFAALPSKIAALVPEGKKEEGGWNVQEYLNPGVRFIRRVHREDANGCRMSVGWLGLRSMPWSPQKKR